MINRVYLYFILVILFYLCVSCSDKKVSGPIIFAPASTSHVLEEILKKYCVASSGCLSSYASSAVLARQIAHGSPADIYISAHPRWMDFLVAKGKIIQKSRKFLFYNRLAFVVHYKQFSSVKKNINLESFHTKKDLLIGLYGLIGKNNCWASGDPSYVPLGMYAKEALKNIDVQLWNTWKAKLVRAADASKALYYIETGECEFGIIYENDIHNNTKVISLYSFPTQLHKPISYEIALTNQAKEKGSAHTLFNLLSSHDKVRFMYQKFGFQLKNRKN